LTKKEEYVPAEKPALVQELGKGQKIWSNDGTSCVVIQKGRHKIWIIQQSYSTCQISTKVVTTRGLLTFTAFLEVLKQDGSSLTV
jgi:hypothetical protein